MRLRLQLLGGFVAEVDGRAVDERAWERRDAARLVQRLALAPQRRVHREELFDDLWPDVDLERAARRLHKAAHYARKALAAPRAIVLDQRMVALAPDDDMDVDAVSFEHAVRSGDVDGALALHRGELLPEERFAEWAFVPRERVRRLYRDALRAAGQWDELVALEPTDEAAHVALMQRMLDSGDAVGARRQFEVLERTLREELGIGPSAEAVALFERAHEPAVVLAPPARAERYSDLTTQTIDFCSTPDGVRLAYAISGRGPHLVKASNWLTHVDYDWASPVWRHWWHALSDDHTLVRYDERGCGLSQRDVSDFTLDAWVRDLETVVDTLGLERFPLLGVSQGGAIAIRYAARHPERVTHVVLYGTGVRGRRLRATSPDELAALDALGELMRASWGTGNPLFHRLYNAMFMPGATLEQWQTFDELQARTCSAENAVSLWRAFGMVEVTEEARSLDVPVLVLHARHDQLRPFSSAEELAALVPGARLVALDSVNHILQEDEPAFAQFIAEIDGFLQR